MKLKFFLLVFLAVSGSFPLVASSPDYVIFNDWIEPGNYITFNQFKLRLVEIIPADKEANMSVTIEFLEDNTRLMYDILKYNETVTPHSDIRIQFNSVYVSSNLKMAKLMVYYKNEDQYVGKSWSDISDTVSQDELTLLRSGGSASVIMVTGGSAFDETLILQNLGSKQANNLVVTFSFPEDESYAQEFSCLLPKTFIGAGESMSVVLSYIPSKNPPKQIRGSIKIGNPTMFATLPIYINASSGQTNSRSDPFSNDPFGGGATSQTQARMYYSGTHLVAGSVNVEPGARLVYYTFSPVNFTFAGAALKSYMGTHEGKTIYYVEVPTTVNGTFNVGVGTASYSVVVGSTAPQYEKGLIIELEPLQDTYKAGEKVKVTLKTTDGLIVSDAPITIRIGDMTYTKNSGFTLTVPELEESDIFDITFSGSYANYGSVQSSISVNNEMSTFAIVAILGGFLLFIVLVIGGIILLLKHLRKGPSSNGDVNMSQLKAGVGKLSP